jgi:hypothetical protein
LSVLCPHGCTQLALIAVPRPIAPPCAIALAAAAQFPSVEKRKVVTDELAPPSVPVISVTMIKSHMRGPRYAGRIGTTVSRRWQEPLYPA